MTWLWVSLAALGGFVAGTISNALVLVAIRDKELEIGRLSCEQARAEHRACRAQAEAEETRLQRERLKQAAAKGKTASRVWGAR